MVKTALTRTSLIIEPGSMSKVPRGVNISKIMRWFLKLITTSDKEWKVLIRKDGEVKEVQDMIRPYLRKALGIPAAEEDKG